MWGMYLLTKAAVLNLLGSPECVQSHPDINETSYMSSYSQIGTALIATESQMIHNMALYQKHINLKYYLTLSSLVMNREAGEAELSDLFAGMHPRGLSVGGGSWWGLSGAYARHSCLLAWIHPRGLSAVGRSSWGRLSGAYACHSA